MGLLDELVGGGQRQTDYRDFIDRFDRGSPYDSIDDDEARRRYDEVAPTLSRDQYRASAEDAFSRLSAQERAEFAQWMRSQGRSQGLDTQDLDGDGRPDQFQDPRELAEATARMRDRDPSIFEQLLGKGGTGGAFDNPIAKMAVVGITAIAAQRLMGGR